MRNHVDVIRLLRQNNAKLESNDNQKCTPLHLACKKGSYEAVSVLLVYEANIYAVDERKWTALHYAAYNGYGKVCKKLLTWSADTDPKLRDSRNSQNKLAFNVCKNPETKLGFRIIWKSAKEGDLDMVRILIREGQDVDEQTQEKRNTALHLSAQHGHILVVRFLVGAEAQMEINNADGKTALDLAKQSLEKIEPEKPIQKKRLLADKNSQYCKLT